MTTFNTLDVIAVANAVYKEQGYVKKNEADEMGYKGTKIFSNSERIYAHFFGNTGFDTTLVEPVKVSATDVDTAEEIIEYFKGLSFKAMERQLTSFEENVLKFVQTTQVGSDTLGIAASLPKVYETKLKQDEWTDRENELSRISEYVGTMKQRETFTAKVENVRWIGRTNSFLTCCSVDDKNILKFFSQEELKQGDTVSVTGFVKSQNVSNFHGGKETMINRVKVNADV